MFLHDWADIFTSFLQAFSETVFTLPSLISAIGMAISWLYTRLIVLPIIAYHNYYSYPYFPEDSNLKADKYLVYFVCVLIIMHYYWFGVLMTAFTKFCRKGEVVDTQCPVEKKKN